MTSRPYAGGGTQRQAQRSVSGTGTVTRPTPQRAYSHQHQPSSSGKKQDKHIDLALEGSLVANDLHGTGSDASPRLKFESSAPSRTLASNLAEPARRKSSTFREPRGQPSLRLGNTSGPQKSEKLRPRSPAEGDNALSRASPMPLPARPTTHRTAAVPKERIIIGSAPNKDTRPKPYVPEIPLATPRYPSNGWFHDMITTAILIPCRTCRLLSLDWIAT